MLVLSAKKIAVNYTLLKLAKRMAQQESVTLCYFYIQRDFGQLNDCEVMPRSKSLLLHHCADSWHGVWLSPNVVLCIMTKHLQFGLICKKKITLQVLWFYQMLLYKPRQCCHVYQRSFLMTTLPNELCLFSVFPSCAVINFNI